MSYTGLLRSARKQIQGLTADDEASRRLSSKGLSGSSFQEYLGDSDSSKLLPENMSSGGSLVKRRAGDRADSSESKEDFMTRAYREVVNQNNRLLEEGSSASEVSDGSGQSTEDFIASFENVSDQQTFKAYWDTDHWSIGFGSRAKSKNETITLEQARARLSEDTSNFRNVVTTAAEKYGYDWDSDQISALTSFTYNLGAGNLEKLLEGGSRGDEEISNMILEYNKADGKVLPGLVKRRKAEAALFSSVN
jgi:lysozyme